MDDDELTRLAEEELLREAKVGEARAAVHGVMGWLDKTPRTNKRFLSNTISNALQHNHRQCTVRNNKETIQEHRRKEEPREHTVTCRSVKTTDGKKRKRHHHKSSKSQLNGKSDDADLSNKLQTNGYHSPKQKQPKLHS